MSIEKVNFHVYADGKRRILVVDNCEGDTLKAFNSILEMVCSIPEGEIKQVPSVVEDKTVSQAPSIEDKAVDQSCMRCITAAPGDDPKLHFPDIILTSGPYAGMTPMEAVSQDGIKAVTILCECSKDIEQESARRQMVDCCKHIISLHLASRPNELSDAEKLTEFFTLYRQLLGGKCLKTLQSNYGVDVDAALQAQDSETLSKVYCSVISDLRVRTQT